MGCHPYPISGIGEANGQDFKNHKWEISCNGGDGVSTQVQYGQTHNQAFLCNVDNLTSGSSTLKFYTQVNSPTSFEVNNGSHPGGYTYAPPHPQKAIVFGNCPWNEAHQHERLDFRVR